MSSTIHHGLQMIKPMSNYAGDITREELNKLPVFHFDQRISVIDDYRSLKEAVNRISQCNILGFDTETKPSFAKGKSNPVALLQLACHNEAFLIRINKVGLPGQITDILQNPAIIKAGVAIRDDLKLLQKTKPFMPNGFVELQTYVKDFGIQANSIKKISGIVLQVRVSKNQQLSDWQADILSGSQLKYAATDAWVCYQIYSILSNHQGK